LKNLNVTPGKRFFLLLFKLFCILFKFSSILQIEIYNPCFDFLMENGGKKHAGI